MVERLPSRHEALSSNPITAQKIVWGSFHYAICVHIYDIGPPLT
jgi:hypothetical protein